MKIQKAGVILSIIKELIDSIRDSKPPKGWADNSDIQKAGLEGSAEHASGLVVGINPYTHKLMLDDSSRNVVLVAPTRSGKGVNTVIPTALVWRWSFFAFDPMGEILANTARYRKQYFHQKVVIIHPTCRDGHAACWNPLAEIRFQTEHEWEDSLAISSSLISAQREGRPDESIQKDAATILAGIILHHLYRFHNQMYGMPSLFDVSEFFAHDDVYESFEGVKLAKHLTRRELFDDHLFERLYGQYLPSLEPFREAFHDESLNSVADVLSAVVIKEKNDASYHHHYDELPCGLLYEHPKVFQAANLFLSSNTNAQDSLLATIRQALSYFRLPIIRKNTEHSDVTIHDILNPKKSTSCYYLADVSEYYATHAIGHLFIDLLTRAALEEKDRLMTNPYLLCMFEELPQLGKLLNLQEFLSVCGNKGIKACLVAQSVGQLNKIYSKDNTIFSNCPVQIYFTPTLEDGGGTAESLAEKIHLSFEEASPKDFSIMSLDDISHMSMDKEIVIVSGQKPIFGDKLRYYMNKTLLRRTQLQLPVLFESDVCTRVYDFKRDNA